MAIILRKDERDLMRKAGTILKEAMDVLSGEINPGISTKELEQKADKLINSRNAKAAFRGYKGFPASICTSRNDVVVHGIPSTEERLEAGDIIGIDIGVGYGGFFVDAARTFKVGQVTPETERLILVAEEALFRGIKAAKEGNHIQDISWAIQSFVEANGFSIVRAFVGHGIGKKIHEPPEVPNFGRPHKGRLLENGMALAIEPMVNVGTCDVEILEDDWTAVTKDGRPSAHFEHTIIVDGEKPEIVT